MDLGGDGSGTQLCLQLDAPPVVPSKPSVSTAASGPGPCAPPVVDAPAGCAQASVSPSFPGVARPALGPRPSSPSSLWPPSRRPQLGGLPPRSPGGAAEPEASMSEGPPREPGPECVPALLLTVSDLRQADVAVPQCPYRRHANTSTYHLVVLRKAPRTPSRPLQALSSAGWFHVSIFSNLHPSNVILFFFLKILFIYS